MSREITVPTPTARLHEVTMAALHREPSAPESVVTLRDGATWRAWSKRNARRRSKKRANS